MGESLKFSEFRILEIKILKVAVCFQNISNFKLNVQLP